MRFGFKRLSPRSSVQRIMAFILVPNKVLCHTLEHISEVSLGTVHNKNSLIFLSSLRQLVLLVFCLFSCLPTFLLCLWLGSLKMVQVSCCPHCTFDSREGKKRMSKCPGPGWIEVVFFYFHFWSSALLSNSQITPVFHPFQFLPLKGKFTGYYIF